MASDIDSLTTLVGGSSGLIARLVEHLRLEALPIGVDDRVDMGSDTINS